MNSDFLLITGVYDARAQPKFVEGTSTELVQRGIIINGVKVDAVGFSVLAKYGIVQIVGKAPKIEGKRGKQGSIYKVQAVDGLIDFVV